MRLYREKFQPSQFLQKPYAILAAAAVVADTDDEADRLASTIDLNFVAPRQGRLCAAGKPGSGARL